MISDSAKFRFGIAIFIIIGVTTFLIAGVEAYTYFGIQKASATWKITPGVITKADISRVSIDNDYVVWRPEYKYELLYRYSVNGQEHHGFRSKIGNKAAVFSKRGASSVWGDYYKEGDDVTVYYNPDAPTESALTVYYSSDDVTYKLLAPLGSSLMAWGIIYYEARKRRKKLNREKTVSTGRRSLH